MGRLRADSLLVARGLIDSRSRARAAIEAGGVFAAGRRVAKPSELLDEDISLDVQPAHDFVGRGALKLLGAPGFAEASLDQAVVLDLGASTGGFTEVCLRRGARLVYAVDVGREQLHSRLKGDPRVVNLEGRDARSLTSEDLPEAPDLVVCDVSFISLAKLLPIPLSLARTGALLFVLVKPQFEVGPGAVGKGGIVRDADARAGALQQVIDFLEGSGWTVLASQDAVIAGADGNQEYLVQARKL